MIGLVKMVVEVVDDRSIYVTLEVGGRDILKRSSSIPHSRHISKLLN
jgi:hypothetical protein